MGPMPFRMGRVVVVGHSFRFVSFTLAAKAQSTKPTPVEPGCDVHRGMADAAARWSVCIFAKHMK